MKFSITCKNPLTHFISIQAEFLVSPHTQCTFHLPLWRPGRYEAANYAKNLKGLRFEDSNGLPLEATKPQLSTWRVASGGDGKIIARYEYFAFRMDAGNSWVDDDLFYLNFINFLLYEPLLMDDPCEVEIALPEGFQVACSLDRNEEGKFLAADFYQLVDSPLLSARELQKMEYSVNNTKFYIWSWGHAFRQEELILQSFRRFTESQLEMMKLFPEKAYHFLLLILPYKFYHGVEHGASTVICLGPGQEIESREMNDQLLGVSSHELFHAWNILKIRPRELFPYKFHEPAYFPTGFVAEGFTTYYGDLFLVRSGVRDTVWYLKELEKLFKRHFDNAGRLSLSVVESSYDLWIDGYQKGAPGRKSSIYVEGAVSALIFDLTIRLKSGGKNSLDDVVRTLFSEFAERNRGYAMDDIRHLISEAAETDLSDLFHSGVMGTSDKYGILRDLLGSFGLELTMKPAENLMERYLGIRILPNEGTNRIAQIYPGSFGEQYFSIDDQILYVNNERFNPLSFTPEANRKYVFIIQRFNREKEVTIVPALNENFFNSPSLRLAADAGDKETERLRSWWHQ